MTPEDFIRESNRIEGIHRVVRQREIDEYHRFMAAAVITISDLERFVSIYQPNARLRRTADMNVRVGNHVAPRGGPEIPKALDNLLIAMKGLGPYWTHKKYETLHPFTDGNGRSGRMLWMWQMREAPLGFLHTWYYQSLQASHSSS